MSEDRDDIVRFDWAIKRLLRDKANFDVLEGFLSVVLHDKVEIIEILESEGNKQTADDKFNRVDIKAKNSKGEIIIVEVQNTREVEAREKLRIISMSKAEQNAYEKYLHDVASFMLTQRVEKECAFQEGMEQGIAQGMEQGLAKGLAQGMEQGIAQGEELKAFEVARKLLAKGIDVDDIADATGLAPDQIATIKP